MEPEIVDHQRRDRGAGGEFDDLVPRQGCGGGDVDVHGDLYVLWFVPEEDVGDDGAGGEGEDVDFEEGGCEVLEGAGDDLGDEGGDLQDGEAFDEGVAFAAVFEVRVRD